MLTGKTIVLGITGSIAAYKIAGLASTLSKLHADIHVIMTENATNFIHPLTFETLTQNKCLTDTFDRQFQYDVTHVSLAKKADVVLVAPASANVIAKMANGIADDMLTTTLLACKCPIIVAPAMNTNMYTNPVVQDNIRKLKAYGMTVLEPEVGMLACKDIGAGKMPSEEVLLDYILKEISGPRDLVGKKVVVTAGATQESIDPVRYITNHSTGKMGYAVAKAAMYRGAEVTLITGPSAQKPPRFVKVIPVKTAEEMYEEVTTLFPYVDVLVMAAAVADYTPVTIAEEKIKKTDGGDISLPLKRTRDILMSVGHMKKKHQFVCGFSMETENLLENSRKKLEKKNLDMVAANSLRVEGAGFGTDTNVLTLITRHEVKELPKMTKELAAHAILDYISNYYHFC